MAVEYFVSSPNAERIAKLGNDASTAVMNIPWGETEEGPDFWVGIHNKLERIEKRAKERSKPKTQPKL